MPSQRNELRPNNEKFSPPRLQPVYMNHVLNVYIEFDIFYKP